MAGLGSYNPKSLYQPLRGAVAERQQLQAGDLAMRAGEQKLATNARQQQQLAAMQQAWSQSGGDPVKFLQTDAAKLLSLDQRAKVMEMGQTQQQQEAAQRLAPQLAARGTQFPGQAGPPEQGQLQQYDEQVADKTAMYQDLATAGQDKFVSAVIGQQFPGAGGGAGGQTQQMIQEVGRIEQIPESERTPDENSYYRYAQPYVDKLGKMRQGTVEKDYNFLQTVLPGVAAGDPQALEAANAVIAKLYKTGSISVTEEAPGGAEVTKLVPAPGAIGKPKAPFITKTTEATATAEGLREDMMGATNYLNLLDTMEKNIGATKSAGSVVPAPVHGAVTKFGLWSGWYGSEEAREWKVAEDKARADVQALIKGIPSNFDAEVFAKTNPSMGVTREENLLRIGVQKEVLRELVGGTIAFYLKTGKQVPEQAIAVAGRLGLDPRVGIPYTGEDPFARANAISQQFLARSSGGGTPPPQGSPEDAMNSILDKYK